MAMNQNTLAKSSKQTNEQTKAAKEEKQEATERKTMIIGRLIAWSVVFSMCQAKPSTRMFGGDAVETNKYPWMVSFQAHYPESFFGVEAADHLCGGALIDSTHVLTSAICFMETNLTKSEMLDYFVAAVDDHEITKRVNESEADYIALQDIRVHPEYNFSGGITNNVAIIELREAVEIPVPFPAVASNQTEYGVGTPCTVLGWGLAPASEVGALPASIDEFSCSNCSLPCNASTCLNGFLGCDEARCYDDADILTCQDCGISCPAGVCQFASDCRFVTCLEDEYKGVAPYEIVPDNMRQANVTVLSEEFCNVRYGEYFTPESNICAGNVEGDKGVCRGDSGSPLVAQVNGTSTIIGIVSFGFPEGCALQGLPGVYSDVSYFRNWITDNSLVDGEEPVTKSPSTKQVTQSPSAQVTGSPSTNKSTDSPSKQVTHSPSKGPTPSFVPSDLKRIPLLAIGLAIFLFG